jgi:hypothetical protein
MFAGVAASGITIDAKAAARPDNPAPASDFPQSYFPYSPPPAETIASGTRATLLSASAAGAVETPQSNAQPAPTSPPVAKSPATKANPKLAADQAKTRRIQI